MRRALIVAIAALGAACSSSAERTNPVRPTTTVRSTTVAPSVVAAASTTTTARPVTIRNSYQFGSFSRSGPWSASVTRDTTTPFEWHAYRSFDGRQWVALPPAPALPRFVDALHGWALGLDPRHPDPDNLMLWSTRDGGLHYESLGTLFGGFHHAGDIGEVQFVDRTHGFATSSTLVASGWSVRRTSDGGRTWQARSSSEDLGAPFGPPAEFEFVSPTEGYASGFTPTARNPSVDLFRTLDGGASWHRFGPVVTGQHGAGLPTIIDDFVLVPILRLNSPGSRVELYEWKSGNLEDRWRLVWSVRAAVHAPAHWQPALLAPDAALIDEDDGLVDLRNDTLVGIRHDQRVEQTLPSNTAWELSASSSLIFLAYYDGIFSSSDNGATWDQVNLPSE